MLCIFKRGCTDAAFQGEMCPKTGKQDMRHHLIIFFILLNLFLMQEGTSLANNQSGATLRGFQKNEVFPTIKLPLLKDGTAVSIKNFRGQKLLLILFASW